MSTSLAIRLAAPVVHGWRRLRLALLPSMPSWRQVPGGFWMRVDPSDFMDQAFLFGSYEPELLYVIGRAVHPRDFCVDIGAHKGYLTLCLASRVGPEGQVLSFEPDAAASAALAEHCARNGFDQVILERAAVGEEDGECEFVLSSQLGFSSRFPNEIAQPLAREVVRVPLRSLDAVIRERGLPDPAFVKLDAEGSELLALRGARETLARTRPVVWMEVNPRSLRMAGCTPRDVLQELAAHGYQVRVAGAGRGPLLQRRFSFAPLDERRLDAEDTFDVVAIARDRVEAVLGAEHA